MCTLFSGAKQTVFDHVALYIHLQCKMVTFIVAKSEKVFSISLFTPIFELRKYLL